MAVVKLVEMTEEYAADIVTWRYPPPYDFYDLVEAETAFFTDPRNGYFALVDESGLIGFRVFGADGRVPGGEYD